MPEPAANQAASPRARARPSRRSDSASPGPWHDHLPTRLLVAAAWLVARLPVPAVQGLGRLLGRLSWRLSRRRRHITRVNLALCFPDRSALDRELLARRAFEEVATGLLEAALPWLNPRRSLMHRVEISGLDNVHRLLARGRGVLLIGGHFATLDVLCEPLSRELPVDLTYRRHDNPVWERVQRRGRERFFERVIERHDMRTLIRRLRQGRVVWYAPDQDYGPKQAVFVPFFGVPAATLTTPARLAARTGAAVVFMSACRDRSSGRWRLCFSEALDDYPSADPVADASRLNRALEDAIRAAPAQYLWQHRRFKTPPPGGRKPY